MNNFLSQVTPNHEPIKRTLIEVHHEVIYVSPLHTN